MKLSKQAHTELVEQDLVYLNSICPNGSLELDHIKLIICKSIDLYYPEKPEQDARERAIKSFMIACEWYDDGRDSCWICPTDPQRKCNRMYCDDLDKFLKTYDNE